MRSSFAFSSPHWLRFQCLSFLALIMDNQLIIKTPKPQVSPLQPTNYFEIKSDTLASMRPYAHCAPPFLPVSKSTSPTWDYSRVRRIKHPVRITHSTAYFIEKQIRFQNSFCFFCTNHTLNFWSLFNLRWFQINFKFNFILIF